MGGAGYFALPMLSSGRITCQIQKEYLSDGRRVSNVIYGDYTA